MKVISQKKGFTLIELLVVIAVIGVLAAVILASLNDARAKARDAKRIADIKQVQTALELYRNDNSDYPSGTADTLSEWNTKLATWLVVPGYLPQVPPPVTGTYRYYSDYVSSATCGGLNFDAYEYVILFNMEKPITSIVSSSLPSYNKCLTGGLK